ncbi:MULTISPECIES: hydrogenase maturation nickel metallochaperone HypA [Ferrimonas]|uniref:hydrogenase maturation nickel metallochaperone HypA n=1 Tax=Ferrimonas TaxID=44011 RepID=UPI0004260C4B|nr:MULTISPECIES: hydrogenase maturation nickel metallochaperone HypA [Ferrimonas]USD36907.1 hydrogenase maturation nickel metallochaperone HypA [Ferrimonas sp. SCSIO 43195]
MHEMSLAEGIVQILENEAKKQNFSRVTEVCLAVGELAGVELESLRFSFDVITRDTLAEGCALTIEPVPGLAYCFDCSVQVPLQKRGDPCPRCGGFSLQVVDGTQMRVKSLEVE